MTKRPPRQIILVVDDVSDNIDVVNGILQQEYQIKVALNGERALKIAASANPPDLILLDVMMPDMDGHEVCRRLKANAYTRRIPIIFVTARNETEDEAIGLELGAVDYITKPVSPAILKARVRTHLALYDQNRILEQQVLQRTRDLTKSNEKLDQERSRFGWVIENAEDGYLIIDQHEKLLYVNPKARLYLGLQQEQDDLPSDKFSDLVCKQYQIEPGNSWNIQSGETTERCLFIRPETKDSHAFWLQADTFSMAISDGLTWMICLRDVTGIIDELRNRYTFSSMIQHKLRTPLVGMSTIRMLVDFSSELSVEDIKKLSKVALQGYERLEKTIVDILRYLDSSGRAENENRFEIKKFESTVMDICTDLSIEKIKLHSGHISQDTLPLSSQMMELIFWELLGNGKKFHPQQNPSMELSMVEVAPGTIKFVIQDDGIRLSPDQLNRLWTPYFQGDKYFTGEIPGIGLGLATVSTIVWEIGGDCRAYNREDKPGFVVEIMLPIEGS